LSLFRANDFGNAAHHSAVNQSMNLWLFAGEERYQKNQLSLPNGMYWQLMHLTTESRGLSEILFGNSNQQMRAWLCASLAPSGKIGASRAGSAGRD